MGDLHQYACRVHWTGSTGEGYKVYDRSHRVSSRPSRTALKLSSDAAFGGNPDLLNPEQLLLIAASSCQLLSFLAVAARARIDVISYSDEPEALMPEDNRPVRITRITLRPHIVIASEVDEDRIRHYVGLAHDECFIANSLTSEIVIESRIELHRE